MDIWTGLLITLFICGMIGMMCDLLDKWVFNERD